AASVWSAPPGAINEFPAAFFLRFLRNHGLIGRGSWQWRTISGGSQAYVCAIVAQLGQRAFKRTPVAGMERTADGVAICLTNGTRREFDTAVLACHANEAAQLLIDASPEESAALGCFSYSKNHVALHTDSAMLPSRERARASWNYVTEDCRNQDSLTVTYHLNRLQALETQTDYCVTVNPTSALSRDEVKRDLCYEHPAYTFRTLEGQQRIAELNGKNRIYFAGAHLGYGFHEDGVASAVRVDELLGVKDA
ncbi:MAG: FAD-dependent oxidoreductase, partial [Rubricoccaceae bacterium]|nr:FAD-dependent oxidoreductase [Rubricoccaceae bacterium]